MRRGAKISWLLVLSLNLANQQICYNCSGLFIKEVITPVKVMMHFRRMSVLNSEEAHWESNCLLSCWFGFLQWCFAHVARVLTGCTYCWFLLVGRLSWHLTARTWFLVPLLNFTRNDNESILFSRCITLNLLKMMSTNNHFNQLWNCTISVNESISSFTYGTI